MKNNAIYLQFFFVKSSEVFGAAIGFSFSRYLSFLSIYFYFVLPSLSHIFFISIYDYVNNYGRAAREWETARETQLWRTQRT